MASTRDNEVRTRLLVMNAAAMDIGPAVGLTATQKAEINTALASLESAMTAHGIALAAAKSATEAKDAQKRAGLDVLGRIATQLRNNPAVSDAQLEQFGVSPRKSTRTPAATPTSRPVATTENVEGLTQVFRLADSDSGKKSKPDGVAAAEMRLKIVGHGQPAPTDVAQLDFAGISTTTKVVRSFDGADQCKTAYWAFRWINTRGEAGPWSAIAAATIAA